MAMATEAFVNTITTLVQGRDDLTMRQLALLLRVCNSLEVQTPRELAAALKLSKPVITRATDKLEAMGYVRRRPDLRDKRSVLITETAAGRKFVNRLESMLERRAS